MKVKKAFWGALVISGSLGMGAAAAHDGSLSGSPHVNDEVTRSGDDTVLPPGVPGISDDRVGRTSDQEAMMLEEALASKGYDPGQIDGMIDSETRAAIREFQQDNDLAVTGTFDEQTEQQILMSRSDERAYQQS